MKSLFFAILLVLAGFAGGYHVAAMNQQGPAIADSAHASGDYVVENGQVLERLEGQLTDANKKIAYLQRMNRSLSSQLERHDLPIPSSITYEDLVERVDKLPVAFIQDQLGRLFDAQSIDQIQDPREFSKRLLEIALDEDEANSGAGSASVVFSTSPVYGSRLLSDNAHLGKYDTVFAHIDASQGLGQVIIKWQHSTTGEILLFKNHPFDSNTTQQYISLRPSKGWQAGQYRVSIHSMDDEAKLVGGNSYTIASVAELDSTTAEAGITQELLMSGQAIPRIQE